MSSFTRRIEKNILKKMGVSRNVSGKIVDLDGRIVGSGPDGEHWPRFADIGNVGGT